MYLKYINMIRSVVKDRQGSHCAKQTLKTEVTREHETVRRVEEREGEMNKDQAVSWLEESWSFSLTSYITHCKNAVGKSLSENGLG